MQTTLIGFKIRFLMLNVLPTLYAILSSTSFLKYANLGTAPAVQTNTSGIEHTAIRYRFTLKTELYTILQNTDKALEKQLLGFV